MKDIYEILKGNGIEIAEDFDKKAFEKELFGSYKTVAEVSKKDDQISELTDKLNTATEGLKAFEGVDVKDLQGRIAKLTDDLKAKDDEWQGKLNDMAFTHSLEDAINSAKGKNTKAIKALLDVETLKASTNRDADVKAAIEAVKKENDYLFESEEQPSRYAGGTGKGRTNGNSGGDDLDAFRRAAGLKTE